MHRVSCLFASAVLAVAVAAAADAARPVSVSPAVGLDSVDISIPRLLSYQGRLTDTEGDPVPDSTWSVQFALYPDSVGQIPFWVETRDVVTTSGLFSVLLGEVNPVVRVSASGNLYLGMSVGRNREMRPRVRLVSSPYAFVAWKADTAEFARSAPAGDSAAGDFAVAGEVRGYRAARFGKGCTANDSFSFAAGMADTARGITSAVVGGTRNVASGWLSFVGGGWSNRATGSRSSILGGESNEAGATNSCIAGGSNCVVSSGGGLATGVGTHEVHVAEDVAGNRFVIGGRPGTRVYWMVTGERRDVSAEAIRRMMPVEQRKTGVLAGHMLDDDFLSGCMGQLERDGKAQGIDFRTATGRQRYEKLRRVLEPGR